MAEILKLWLDLVVAVVKAVADGVTEQIKFFYGDRRTIDMGSMYGEMIIDALVDHDATP